MKYISSMPGIRAEADVSYNFICEHCERDSGITTKTFESFRADTSYIKGSQPLPPEYFDKMTSLAKRNDLKEKIDKLQEQEKNGKYRDARISLFSQNPKAKCPHCGMYQSWMSKELWKVLFQTPLIFGIVVLMILTFYSMFKFGLDDMHKADWFKFMIITIIAMVVGLLVGIHEFIETKKRTGKIKIKRIPTIHYPDLEFAHTEIVTVYFNQQGEISYEACENMYRKRHNVTQ